MTEEFYRKVSITWGTPIRQEDAKDPKLEGTGSVKKPKETKSDVGTPKKQKKNIKKFYEEHKFIVWLVGTIVIPIITAIFIFWISGIFSINKDIGNLNGNLKQINKQIDKIYEETKNISNKLNKNITETNVIKTKVENNKEDINENKKKIDKIRNQKQD